LRWTQHPADNIESCAALAQACDFARGAEWALWDRWTAKVEYIYLNTDNTGVTTPVANFAGHVPNNVVRSGLNYHF
jgi:opacity protein-like surface antigen